MYGRVSLVGALLALQTCEVYQRPRFVPDAMGYDIRELRKYCFKVWFGQSIGSGICGMQVRESRKYCLKVWYWQSFGSGEETNLWNASPWIEKYCLKVWFGQSIGFEEEICGMHVIMTTRIEVVWGRKYKFQNDALRRHYLKDSYCSNSNKHQAKITHGNLDLVLAALMFAQRAKIQSVNHGCKWISCSFTQASDHKKHDSTTCYLMAASKNVWFRILQRIPVAKLTLNTILFYFLEWRTK